jgi:rsbT co-antagonist protein RsbR
MDSKPEDKTTAQILIELFMTQVGEVTNVISEKGHTIFENPNLLSEDEISDYSLEFLELLVTLLHAGEKIDRRSNEFKALRYFFDNLASQIQVRGGTLEEFVRYIRFMQHAFLDGLEGNKDLTFNQIRDVLLMVADLFNDILMDVFRLYLSEKEKTIKAQQEELRETSTPIAQIWDGVLTLPIIGTLDSSRALSVMEKLLSRIEDEHANVVLMDVTGVLAIDSQVSHHLIQMIRAIGLMGAQPILTGIRPDIARSLTSLNIDLGDVLTCSTLSDGLKKAFEIMSVTVSSTTGNAA